jgi:GrpB-like predicted nucleotidyltransferase (UPF0157 family)
MSYIVQVVAYDPTWPERFAREAAVLRSASGLIGAPIEHIGSTAVPGLAAKPTIDIAVGLGQLDDADPLLAPLSGLGYEYQPQAERVVPSRRFLRKGPASAPTYHLHLVECESPEWERWITFRDYLRAHPDATHAYEQLKWRLAAENPDSEAYTAGKGPFIEAVLTTAQGSVPRRPCFREPAQRVGNDPVE